VARTPQVWPKKCRNMGLHIEDYILYTSYFMEEQIVIMEAKDNLSHMVWKLQEAYKQGGLIINKKSENMIFDNNEKEDLPLQKII
jgi:hypothetical protein